MQQAGYHHANMLASQLQATIDSQGTEMIEMLQGLQGLATDDNAPNVHPTPPTTQAQIPPPHPTANAAAQPDVQLEILRMLGDMQQSMPRGDRGRRSARGRGGQAGREGRGGAQTYQKTPDNATFLRRVTNDYCWTHGGCNHGSNECSRQAPGHNNSATRGNRLGGSNDFCQPVA